MVQTLLLTSVLVVGQTASAPLGSLPTSPVALLQPPSARVEKQNGDSEEQPKEDQRYFLMKTLGRTCFGSALEQHKISISGWTHMSFTASSTRNEHLPMGFNYRANEFLLQQNWLRIERPVDTDSKCASLGFRADTILPGSDYRFTTVRGLFDGQLTANNGNSNSYGIDPIQFYGEAYFPNVGKGLSIKVGRFFAQFGVEANDAPSNALLSHAYTYIYNPFTHTGALATLKLDDTWSVQAGLVLGCDVFIDPAAEPTFLGSIKWAPRDGKDTVLFSVILGSGRFNQAENFHNPQAFDLVLAHKFNDKLSYTFEGLYGFTNGVPNTGFANWFGVLNYLTYECSSKLSATGRLEFFDDFQGQRTGFQGLYTTITAGIAYKANRAVTFRPEVRYDYNAESRPFENRRGLFTAAADVIIRW